MDSLIHVFDQAPVGLGLFLVALAGLGEYLFPPLPGDTLMLFGFFLAGRGELPFAGTLGAALGGSMLGAWAAYELGSRMGHSYYFLRRSRLTATTLPVLERYLARFGVILLLINRFLPVLRGFFLYAAGMGRMRRAATLLAANLSNLAWVLLIAWVGHRFGSSWERLQEAFRTYAWFIGILLSIYVAVTVLVSRRQRRKAANSPG